MKWVRTLKAKLIGWLVNHNDLEVKRVELDRLERKFRKAYSYDQDVVESQIEYARKRFQELGKELTDHTL